MRFGVFGLASGSLTVMVVALAADAQAKARTADRENFIFYSKLEERRSYRFCYERNECEGRKKARMEEK
jgi:hypothetical protein